MFPLLGNMFPLLKKVVSTGENAFYLARDISPLQVKTCVLTRAKYVPPTKKIFCIGKNMRFI